MGEQSKTGLLTILIEVTHVDFVLVVMVLGAVGAVEFDSLFNADSVLDGRADARGLDGGLGHTNVLPERRRADAGSFDGSFGHTDVLLYRRADAGSVDGGLVDTYGLGENLRSAVGAVDSGLSYADVLTIAGLVSSTVFTLDLVDGAVVLLRQRLVVAVVVVVVVTVPVGVNFNVGVRVRGTSRSIFTRVKQDRLADRSHSAHVGFVCM